MKIYSYDFEVVSHDWLCVFKLFKQDEWVIIHNDNVEMMQFMNQNEDTAFIGFNSKSYDQFIMKGIMLGFDMEEIKRLNDYLIAGGQGWEYPEFQGYGYGFNNIDIMNDMQKGLSLKAIEGHLGLSVEESSISFDIDRPLTDSELAEMIHYCKHDVETTERVSILRQKYLQTKIDIGKMAGLEPIKAMSMTNAKLTAALLKATRKEHDDEREYKVPDNLKREYIPQEVFDFFARIHDPTVSDEEFFKSKMNLKIGDCDVTIGLGGIHGSINHFIWEEESNER